ncbi:hypothetical protein LCGC14_0876650 [marine sediment metagenome]|uniref:Uncharacterized protein n=1 Tax=marine sediment metagenome TaxID=412755 RepID=A0A0F9SA51_9ZZZZ
MEVKNNSGNSKILLVLQDTNKSMSVKTLAEKTGISYKNIHRNITQLFNSGYITANTLQEGRCRNKYIFLTPLGKSYNASKWIEKSTRNTTATEEFEHYDSNFSQIEVKECSKFGIRFYAWLARELEIPKYYDLSLDQLKLQIGLRLLYQSRKIDVSDLLDKYNLGEA